MLTSLRISKDHHMLGLIVVCAILISTIDGAAASYDVYLDFEDESNIKEKRGSDPVRFNYTVSHIGDALSELVSIQVYNVPSNWMILFTTLTQHGIYTSTYSPHNTMDINLSKGEQASLHIVLTPPLNSRPGIYWMKLDVWPEKNRGQNDSHDFAVVIGQYAASEVVLVDPPPSNVFETIPQSSVSMRFALYNTGNGDDAFQIIVESSHAEYGWNHSRIDGIDASRSTPTMAPDQSKITPHIIDVTVPTPVGMRSDETCIITLRAYSLFDPAGRPSSAQASIHVQRIFGLGVVLDVPEEASFRPGDRIVINATIENQGNGWDQFDVTADWTDPKGETFDFSIEPSDIELDPNVTGTVSILIDIPEGAKVGSHVLTILVASRYSETCKMTTDYTFEVATSDLALPPTPTYIHPEDGSMILPLIVVRPDVVTTFELPVVNSGSLDANDVSLFLWVREESSGDEGATKVLEMTMPIVAAGETFTIGDLGSGTSLTWSSDTSGIYLLKFELVYPDQTNFDNDVSSVIVVVNLPPVVEIDNSDIDIIVGGTFEASGTATDDSDVVEWVKYRIDEGPWKETNGTAEWSIVIERADLSPGEHRLEVLAYDGYEESPSLETTFEVKENIHEDDPPWIVLFVILLVLLVITVAVLRLKRV